MVEEGGRSDEDILEEKPFAVVDGARLDDEMRLITISLTVPREKGSVSASDDGILEFEKVTLMRRSNSRKSFEIVLCGHEIHQIIATDQSWKVELYLRIQTPCGLEFFLFHKAEHVYFLRLVIRGGVMRECVSSEFTIEVSPPAKRTFEPERSWNESSPKRFKNNPNCIILGVWQDVGRRAAMEDTYSIVMDNKTLEGDAKTVLAGNLNLFLTVADGHGSPECSSYVRDNLWKNILESPDYDTNMDVAIETGFSETDERFLKIAKEKELDGMVGSTVTIVLIQKRTIYVGNVGDTEAFVCRGGKVHLLTQRHVPGNSGEKSRVLQVKGKLIRDKSGVTRLAHPVWNPQLINLGISRSIGDFFFKGEEYVGNNESGLVSRPHITEWTISDQDQFLLIATDGLWDAISYQNAADFVISRMTASDSCSICKELVEWGKRKGSLDNVTVLLAIFSGSETSE